jgi:hypothetical protein
MIRRITSAPAKPKRLTAKTEVLLEISLKHIKPRIWRGFSVPGGIRLDRLHQVIQTVMGWMDCHLHAFCANHYEFVQFDPDFPAGQIGPGGMIQFDETKHRLADLIRTEGDKFSYTYDFGDDWEHEVKVKAILPMVKPPKAAHCIAGARACPPEDCGSIPGYYELCEALPHPKHPRHMELKDWIGEYDPELLNLDQVNSLLKQIRV